MTDPAASITDYWDAAASAFDDEPDHGLRAGPTRAAWARLLGSWLPSHPVDVLDAGCGTGSLSLLLAEAGHRVTGVDLAPRMVEQARTKLAAAGHAARFLVGDAAIPPTGDRRFDVLLSRHLVWTLPDPEAALREWVTRLRPGGRLVLVEGRWREAGQKECPMCRKQRPCRGTAESARRNWPPPYARSWRTCASNRSAATRTCGAAR